MRRALLILAFAALILLGSVVTGLGKTGGGFALMGNLTHFPTQAHVDFAGIVFSY